MEDRRRPSGLFESFRRLGSEARKEKRRFPRKDCSRDVEYLVRDEWCRGFVRNISEGGVYIESAARLFKGAEILLDPLSFHQGEQVRGVVMWVDFHGMGVEFRKPKPSDDETPDLCELETVMHLPPGRQPSNTGRVRKKRVLWEGSPGAGKYRLYWSKGGPVTYDSDFVEAGGVKQIVLPDDVVSFPLDPGEMELGVSALNQAGNESDLARTKVYLDFTVPGAPRNLRVEDR